ncbi:hypothetical protein FPV67DRAFT_1654462 [Lyophyllum atratum]|nr:hypothetical protein FPV67DRAFT_1654462 [Lyophyllum atratum]
MLSPLTSSLVFLTAVMSSISSTSARPTTGVLNGRSAIDLVESGILPRVAGCDRGLPYPITETACAFRPNYGFEPIIDGRTGACKIPNKRSPANVLLVFCEDDRGNELVNLRDQQDGFRHRSTFPISRTMEADPKMSIMISVPSHRGERRTHAWRGVRALIERASENYRGHK